MLFGGAWQGRRVLVTGHTGFKGTWLSAWLIHLGATVCGLSDNIPTTPAHFSAIHLEHHLEDRRGDIRDLKTVLKVVQEFQPEVIFHLAAQALVRQSYADPVTTFSTNVAGMLNVLESIRQTSSVQAAVLITSDKCYRNAEWVWGYRETDPLGGSDPYSASKGCAELIAQAYFQSFFANRVSCATARAGNVIGGGDWAKDRLIPDCARAWSAHQAVVLRNPHSKRPWQFVLEPLSGYLLLGARLLAEQQGQQPALCRGQAYNFGPADTETFTSAQVVQQLAGHWPGFTMHIEPEQNKQAQESVLLKLCCDQALAHLQWKATLNLEETLRYTAEWYRRFYAGDLQDLDKFTFGQIEAYTNIAEQRSQVWCN